MTSDKILLEEFQKIFFLRSHKNGVQFCGQCLSLHGQPFHKCTATFSVLQSSLEVFPINVMYYFLSIVAPFMSRSSLHVVLAKLLF